MERSGVCITFGQPNLLMNCSARATATVVASILVNGMASEYFVRLSCKSGFYFSDTWDKNRQILKFPSSFQAKNKAPPGTFGVSRCLYGLVVPRQRPSTRIIHVIHIMLP